MNLICGRAVISGLLKVATTLERASVPFFPHRSAMAIAGIVLSYLAELVTEVTVFLSEHGPVELATLFDENKFQLKVFYAQISLVF